MPKRRIKRAMITHISLVPQGANKMPVIYKADDQTVQFSPLLKADEHFDDNGELTALVYVPEHEDAQGDIASAAVIKDMMYDAAKRGVEIDLRHDGKALAKEQAYVAEQFLVQKGDTRFDGMKDRDGAPVNAEGSWATVIKIEDTELRQKYRNGEWSGVSMFGTAEVVAEKQEDMAEQVATALAKRLGLSTGDDDMKPEEMTQLLEKNNEKLATAIAAEVAKAIKPAEETKAKEETEEPKKTETAKEDKNAAPEFKGDPTKLEDIQKHQREVELWRLRKDVDFSDPEQIAKYQEDLAEMLGDDEESEEEDTPKSKRKTTTRPVGKSNDDDPSDGGYSNVSKEDRVLAKTGSAMAAYINNRRGMATASAD